MTTSTAPLVRSDVPLFSVAGAFLEGLATHAFPRLAATLAEDAVLTALVPSGLKQWHGREEIGARFRFWFGGVSEFELIDAVGGAVAPRLPLRWRVRVRAERLGEGWFVVEQQV